MRRPADWGVTTEVSLKEGRGVFSDNVGFQGGLPTLSSRIQVFFVPFFSVTNHQTLKAFSDSLVRLLIQTQNCCLACTDKVGLQTP